MRSSRRMLLIFVAALLMAPALAEAGGIYAPGIGARASGMGGAFIGLADDYSAVFWNPAGITQIEGMEVTVTGQDLVSLASRDGTVRFEGLEGEGPPPYGDDGRFLVIQSQATSDSGQRLAPGFFFYSDAGPLEAMVDKVGLCAYTLTEYGSKWAWDDVVTANDYGLVPGSGFGGYDFGIPWTIDEPELESRIKSYVIAPVLAKEVFPGLSVGVSANFTYSHYTLKDALYIQQPLGQDPFYMLVLIPIQTEEDATGWGYGATAGVHYRINRELSAGLSVRSRTKISYEGTWGYSMHFLTQIAPDVFVDYRDEDQYTMDFEMVLPTVVGAGVAYRDFLFDGLTVTADATWTDWSTFEEINRNIAWGAEGDTLALFGADPFTELNWDDTFQVALGFDYRLGRSTSLNLGYRNQPSPAPDETYDFLLPQIPKNVVTAGFAYRQDFWRLGLALEYQIGSRRDITNVATQNGKHLEDLMIPTLSFTYAF